jgi:predicted RNA methylase
LLNCLAAYLAAERGLAPPPAARSSPAESLVSDADSPHRLLSDVYEALLQLMPVQRDGGVVLRPASAERKRRGAYFTPPAIAAEVVRAALAGAPPRPRVLDPAMGTGVFLLEAIRQLAPSEDSVHLAETCLFGVDLDPIAVHVAVLSLWLETGARPERLKRHLVHGDALSRHCSLPQADVVLGNPPWGAEYGEDERRSLSARFPRAVCRSFDSAKLFVDLGSRVSRGTLGLVLPHAFLAQEKHADVRGLLLERMSPRAALDLGNAFPGAAAPTCALVFGPRPGPETVSVRGEPSPASLWTEEAFPIDGIGRRLVLLELQRRHPRLGDLSHLLLVRDVGLNYNRASVARRSLYASDAPDHPLDRPRYRGRDFARYGPIRRGGWLRHDAEEALLPGEALSYCRETMALPAKIVLRQTADRLVATVDYTRMVMGRSVIAVVVKDPAWLLPLLAWLNSAPVTGLYRTLAGEEGRVLPQVKVARLHALPIPAHDQEEAAWKCLGALGQRLLAADGSDTTAEGEIDLLVTRMYGLTERDAALLV